MKITVTRRELKNMTAGFSKIIVGRTNLAVLACARFSNQDGAASAQVTDLDQTACYSLDNTSAEGEGAMLVPLDLLRKLAKGTDKETVVLEGSADKITVTNNIGNNAVVSVFSAIDPADWPAAGSEIRTESAPGFISAYRQLVPFASTDPTRPTLCAVYVDAEGGSDPAMVATDGRRLTLIKGLELPELVESAIVPVSKFLTWAQFPEDVAIGVSGVTDNKRLCVKAGPWTYRIKLCDGVYPNYRQVIPSANEVEHRLVFSDNEVKALRQIIPAFPGEESITFQGNSDGSINLCGKDREGINDLSIPLVSGGSYEGSGCRVTLNRNFLLDAFSAGFKQFMFKDERTPLLSSDGKGGTHVLMPLRCNGPSKPAESVQDDVAESEAAQVEAAEQAQAMIVDKVPEAAVQLQPQPESTTTPIKEENTMPKNITTETEERVLEVTALERMLVAYDALKTKVRESQTAMTEMAPIIREAVKEDRNRRREVENVRAGLQKLQSIQV